MGGVINPSGRIG